MKKLFFALISFIFLSMTSQAAKQSAEESIVSALKCEHDVLETFRELEKEKTSLLKKGITFFRTGNEMDERIKLTFKQPLDLYGNKANLAEMYIDGDDFIVFADFTGDPLEVIKRLGLKQIDPNHKEDFVDRVSQSECPKIQRLRKIGSRKFRFGCGWCNGG